MVGKKLLSLVSVLFAGSQLISMVKAADCTLNYDRSEPSCTTNCAKGYYAVKGTANTFVIGTAGNGETQKYVMVTGEDACDEVDPTGITSCSSSTVGKLASIDTDSNGDTPDDVVLCLTNGKYTKFEGGDFLMEGTLAGEVPFTYGVNTNLVVKASGTSVVANSAFTTGGEVYCTNENNKLESRFGNFCSSASCDGYYTCASGTCNANAENECRTTPACNPATAASACGDGSYYIVDSGNDNAFVADFDSAVTPVLYQCSKAEESAPVTCSNLTNASKVPVGYIRNGDSTTATDIPFFKCNGSVCEDASPIPDTASSGKCFGAGALIKVGGSYRLCKAKDDTSGIELTDGSYFIDVSDPTNYYGITLPKAEYPYVIVDVTQNSALLHGKDETDKRYKYTDQTTLKIIPRNADSTTKESVCGTGITEFELDQCEGYGSNSVYFYSKGADSE